MAGEGGRWGLTRIAFGCATLADIAPRQKALLTHDGGGVRVTSRRIPRRDLAGGHLFWFIRHALVARQAILGLGEEPREDGPVAVFHLDPAVVPVEARPHRAHQGWRYLAEADWPADLRADEDALPPALAAALGRLGL